MRKAHLFIAGFITLLSCRMARADLFEYVRREEPAYRWEKLQEKALPKGKMVDLKLTSQVWRGIKWEHRIVVFIPAVIEFPQTAVLLNTGGDATEADRSLAAKRIDSLGCIYAILYQIPNQPLFDGLTEDRLIAYTFAEFLKSNDETWPLLFPMAKSVIKAMDALQEFSRQELPQQIEDFIITGASKRGWTTWLTAVADHRVKAIMPMVYDNLNIPAQMEHQLATWGTYSEQIDEYTSLGLQAKLSTPGGQRLVKLIDPYCYREKLTMPKLIINATNDRYWTLDALRLYWDDLPGIKHVLYVPNVGHGFQRSGVQGSTDLDSALAWNKLLSTTIGYARLVAAGVSLPALSWDYGNPEANPRTIRLQTEPQAKQALLWLAKSDTRDFRSARWEAQEMTRKENHFTVKVSVPPRGFAAFFLEATFKVNGRALYLSTPVQIVP